jgi:hypothetical protein
MVVGTLLSGMLTKNHKAVPVPHHPDFLNQSMGGKMLQTHTFNVVLLGFKNNNESHLPEITEITMVGV